MSILSANEPATAEKKRGGPVADGADAAKPDVNVVKSISQPQPKKDKIKRRRLHVAGLPAISEQEAIDRFKSFGKVTGVDGLGKLDENGLPLRYAFIDIETTKSKLSQCMNLLSGSVWKGSTLRIAEAKRSRLEKIDAERKQEAKKEAAAQVAAASESAPAVASKKRKRPDGNDNSAELVTVENVKSKKGWKLDPVTKTPIFPITMRPDRPIPPASEAPPASVAPVTVAKPTRLLTAEEKKAAKSAEKDAKKAARKAAKKAEAKADQPPPTRARRVKIDSTRWQKQHLRDEQVMEEADRQVQGYVANEQALMSPQPSEADEEERQSSDADDGGAQATHTAAAEMDDAAQSEAESVETESPLQAAVESDEAVNDVASNAASSPEESRSESEAADAGVTNDEPQDAEMANAETITAAGGDDEQIQHLTEIFRPQEAGPMFSLADLLDEEDMDELPIHIDEPYTHGATQTAPVSFTPFPQYDAPLSTNETHIPSRFAVQTPTFFMFPFDGDFDEGGAFADMTEKDRAALLDRSWTGVGESRRFKRTQTLEEITAQHDAARRVLNEQVRKRHREAVRKHKRGGNRSALRYIGED